jgi:hypothetical protein
VPIPNLQLSTNASSRADGRQTTYATFGSKNISFAAGDAGSALGGATPLVLIGLGLFYLFGRKKWAS